MTTYKAAVYARTIQILANLCVLTGVGVGMYHASHNPEAALSVFCSWFFPILLVVITGAILAMRLLRRALLRTKRTQNAPMSVVCIPKIGPRLVRWTVLEKNQKHARRL